MPTDICHPDVAVASAIVGQTLAVHKAEHISLAGARTLLSSVTEVIARRHPAPAAEPVSWQLEPYFERVQLEHRAGLLTPVVAARKLMQAVAAAAQGDARSLEALRLPHE